MTQGFIFGFERFNLREQWVSIVFRRLRLCGEQNMNTARIPKSTRQMSNMLQPEFKSLIQISSVLGKYKFPK